MDHTLIATLKERAESELRRSVSRLPSEEAMVLALLQQRMERQIRPARQPDSKRAQRGRKHKRTA
jgi:hypothetical protein